MPSTLAGVLQARIDGLPPAEKAALQQASVIGHVFWDEALQRIAPTAGAALDGLTRRELAYGRETSAFEGTREFVFKHHVLHQVAYQGVLKQSRREQHRLTADWLVVRSGDRASEYFGLIAEHYETRRRHRQRRRTTCAGRRGRGAQLRQRGGARLPRPRPRAVPPTTMRRPASRCSRRATRRLQQHRPARESRPKIVAALEQAAEQLDDDLRRARAAATRARVRARRRRLRRRPRRRARRSTWPKAGEGARGRALARINWARALQFQGDYSDGALEQLVGESLALARELGDRTRRERRRWRSSASCRRSAAATASRRGYYQQALDVARAIGDRSLESGMINNLGETEQLLGNYDAALDLFQAGRRLCAEIGQRLADAYLLCNMALSAFRRGDAAGSIESATAGDAARRGAEGPRPAGDPALRPRPRARGARRVGRGARRATTRRSRSFASSAARPCRPSRSPGSPGSPSRAATSTARWRRSPRSSPTSTPAARSTAPRIRSGSTSPATRCSPRRSSPRAAEFLERAHALLSERAAPLGDAERATLPRQRADQPRRRRRVGGVRSRRAA